MSVLTKQELVERAKVAAKAISTVLPKDSIQQVTNEVYLNLLLIEIGLSTLEDLPRIEKEIEKYGEWGPIIERDYALWLAESKEKKDK